VTGMESQSRPQDAGAGTVGDVFYSRAVERITQSILILGVLVVPVLWIRYGVMSAGGFLLGVAISYVNFHWLTRAVSGLASRIVEAHSEEKGIGIVIRFLVRYFLIGLAIYVTFVCWPEALNGLLAGLCLPVAGMMGEAAFEAYRALRRGL
jgi:hypothetical protein